MSTREVMQLAFDALREYYKDDAPVMLALETEIFKPEPDAAITRFYACEGDKEESPLERLRFFCSLAMNGQDWLDSEQFFDALEDCHKARSVLRDAMAALPVKWDEDRMDIIGPNGNDGLHYALRAELAKPEPEHIELKINADRYSTLRFLGVEFSDYAGEKTFRVCEDSLDDAVDEVRRQMPLYRKEDV
jgi:hypothetical protein